LNPREDIEEAYEALFINFDKNGAGTVEKGDLLYLIKDLVTE
jgi:Ca2+-binding EF-hand superfamily protein